MTDLIDRQDAIDLLKKWADGYTYIEIETELAIKEFQHLPSAQLSLLDALKIIEQFLQGCRDLRTCEIVAPNGTKLHTDWGYFEEGLEELKRYAERGKDE